ncbi:MAG: acyltransferase [Breoghania sp.]|nr:acyltransferase [Breoghania sp.]MDJ0931894.1 acyltransferase [Breoghania sp.]
MLPFDGHPPLSAAWTLSYEMLFYLIFGLAIVNRRLGVAVLCLWTFTCAAAMLRRALDLIDLSYPLSFLLTDYNILFAFGIVSALLFRSLSVNGASGVLAAGGVVFAIAAYLVVWHDQSGLAVVFGLAAALVITALVRFEIAGKVRVSKGLVRLGDASYSVYLMHGPVIVFVAMILDRLGLASCLRTVTTMGVMVVAGLVAGLVLHVAVERSILRVLSKYLVGRRLGVRCGYPSGHDGG